MRYCINPYDESPIMLLDGEVGNQVDGEVFARELLAIDTLMPKSIQVWINSIGGDVMQGMSIYNAILRSNTKVNTYCVGIAASIAAVIFQAGRTRYMADYGLLMFHGVSSDSASSEVLSIVQNSVEVMAGRCGKTKEEMKDLLNGENWFNADDALKMKLCDQIEASSDYNRKKQISAANTINDRLVLASTFLNKHKAEIKTNMDLKAIATKLNLSNEANIEEITAKIDEVTAQKAEAEAKANEAEQTITSLKAELEEFKNKEKEAEYAAILNDAEEKGQIAKESFAELKNLSLQSLKNLLATLPKVKNAVSITFDNNSGKKSEGIPSDRKDWTWKDWTVKDTAGLVELKNSNPEAYTALYAAHKQTI